MRGVKSSDVWIAARVDWRAVRFRQGNGDPQAQLFQAQFFGANQQRQNIRSSSRNALDDWYALRTGQ